MRLLVGRAVLPLVCWAGDTSDRLSVEQKIAGGDSRREQNVCAAIPNQHIIKCREPLNLHRCPARNDDIDPVQRRPANGQQEHHCENISHETESKSDKTYSKLVELSLNWPQVAL